jgi:heavy metal sensor kinase
LTLWFAVVVGLVLVVAGGGLAVVLRQWLYAELDENLRAQTAVVLAAARTDRGTPAFPVEIGKADAEELFLRLFDADGGVVFDNGAAVGGVPRQFRAIEDAGHGRESLASLMVDEGETVRVATVPMRDAAGNVVGVLQVGLDRHDADETVADLGAAMLLVAPLALLAAGGAGYVLAGRALRPVAEITRQAAAIDGKALDARLALDLPDDELGRLARTFDEMLARIEDAFERQRRFTGDAAHELRSPLGLLRSRIDITLARPRSGHEYEAALREAQRDVERLSAVVAGLLTLARSDAAALPIEPASLDLGEVAADVLAQYADEAAEAEITLVDATTSIAVLADPDLLVRLLVNLVDNALRHTPPGGAITVGTGTVSKGSTVCLWVTDTGVGITPQDQERIFDRFYRIDAGRTRADGGAGLGLAICHAVAVAHGGRIEVESEPGNGSTFTVTLPTGLPPPARLPDADPPAQIPVAAASIDLARSG